MRVAVTGAGGLLGTTLVPLWRSAGAEVIAWARHDLDVTDEAEVVRAVRDARPEVVVHAAAYTAVDRAEAEPEIAMRANRDGTAHVCGACAQAGAAVVLISTDYVFHGTASAPIPPEAPLSPLGAYARSKAEAERATRAAAAPWTIVRSGWLYGPGGENFVDTMRRAAASRRAVTVVDDQVGAPTPTSLVAEALWGLTRRALRGVWHVAAAGTASWFAVARTVYQAAGAAAELVSPCSSDALARPAPRPAYSVLECGETERALGVKLPEWRGLVEAYVAGGKVGVA